MATMSDHPGSATDKQAEMRFVIIGKSITGFITLFCFLLFPAFAIFNALDMSFNIRQSNFRQQKLEQMRYALEQLERVSDNSRYLHLILQKTFTAAQDSSSSKDFLARSLANLRKQYPNEFEFIVWDSKGGIIRELTDQQSFRYIISKLYEVLKEAAGVLSLNDQAIVNDLPQLTKNLNLIRQFLGRIFIPDTLRKPYLRNNEAGPVLSDFAGRYSYFWYQMGERYSLFCFISERLIKSNTGLTKLKNHMNALNQDFWCGFYLSRETVQSETHIPAHLAGNLATALSTFDNLAEPVFENDRCLILINLPQPGIKTWCIHEKQSSDWSVKHNRDAAFVRIAAIMLIFYIILFSWFRLKQEFFSIRWKLTGLFIIANTAPLAIMGFISHDYLHNKNEAMHNELKTDLSKFIRNFDSRFPLIKDEISEFLNQNLDTLNQKRTSQSLSQIELNEIKKNYEKFNPTEVYLISSATQTIIAHKESSSSIAQKIDFIPALGAAVIKFCNGILISRNKNDMFSSILSPDDSDFVRRSFRDSRQITPVNMGQIQKLCYWFILGNRIEYATDHFLILMWERERLQEYFLDKYIERANMNLNGFRLHAETLSGARVWHAGGGISADLRQQLHRAAGFRDSISGTVMQKDMEVIFAAQRGRNLDNIILAATCPKHIITGRIKATGNIIAFGGALSILLTLIICHVISGQFLLPIRNLKEATTAISQHKFNHRIPVTDEDEFGRLNMVFNRVIEGMGELEIARIVQESLFPGNHFKAGNYQIYGKSVVMTTLGGDYYDCLPMDNNKWGVVIGDVAGHGVPAGLMMAMAKAGVLMSGPEEKTDPAKLTSHLHQIFFAIKNDRLKRMMTFQYYVVDPEKYEFSFANAGHCFPVLLNPAAGTAEFIEHISTPLGIGPKARYKNYTFNVKPGEALVLYTDGIAEAKNAQGEEFGFEKLKPLFLNCYDPDPEIFYQRVYAAYNAWSNQPDDDLTLIMITCPEEVRQ